MDRWLLVAKEAVYMHFLFRVECFEWMIRFGEIENWEEMSMGYVNILSCHISGEIYKVTQNLV